MYRSGVTEKQTEVKIDFNLSKTIWFKNNDDRDHSISLLKKLKEDSFGLILIPDFSFSKGNCVIEMDVEFIKGFTIGTLIPKYREVVKKELVDRDSDWTFGDYHTPNFIVEDRTEKIYAVDLQSYGYFPDRNHRNHLWNKAIARCDRFLENLLFKNINDRYDLG